MKIKRHQQATPEIDIYLRELAGKFGLEELYESSKTRYTYSDGLKISIEVFKKDAHAPTIVLIPGATMYALCYGSLIKEMYDRGYNVVAFDPRGHGKSGGERGDYTFSELIRDTQAVVTWAIDNLNNRISLLGSDQGAIVALYTAASDDRVKSIICKNIADLNDRVFRKLEVFNSKRKILQPVVLGLSGLFPNMKLPIYSYLNFKNVELKGIGPIREFMEKDPLVLRSLKAKTLTSILNYKPARTLEQFNTPIFVMQAEKDNIFPLEYTQSIFDKLSCKKRMEILPGLSHTMLTEQAEKVAPLIASWLEEIHGSAQKDVN